MAKEDSLFSPKLKVSRSIV